jgi:hypothetical protein
VAQHARGAGLGSAGSAGGGGRWRGGGLGLASSANIRSTWGLGATAVAKRAAATDRRSAMAAGDIAVARRPFRRATVVDGPRRTQHLTGGGGRGRLTIILYSKYSLFTAASGRSGKPPCICIELPNRAPELPRCLLSSSECILRGGNIR